MKLSTLDTVAWVVSTPQAPLDFAVMLTFVEAPSHQALRQGAQRAFAAYPASACKTNGKRWLATLPAPLQVLNSTEELHAFLEAPFDVSSQAAVQQAVLHTKLITRFHHALFDAVSAALWLSCQLSDAPKVMQDPLTLRHHKAPVRLSQFAFAKPSHPVHSHASNALRRAWHTVTLPAVHRAPGTTPNDNYAAGYLEALYRWNRSMGAPCDRMGLWYPVNIRRRGLRGFGNGSSRIRIYRSWDDNASAWQRAQQFSLQCKTNMQEGEWFVPPSPAIKRLPGWILRPLLRAYFSRPGVDMGSSSFTLSRLSQTEGWLTNVQQVECMGQVHKTYPFNASGVILRGTPQLTFTYLPERVSLESLQHFVALYFEVLAEGTQ